LLNIGYVDLRMEFGTLYEQDLFADLYADRGHLIEVARRQTDGTWCWLIGDPYTVGREVGS
jgi:hypothetical protein